MQHLSLRGRAIGAELGVCERQQVDDARERLMRAREPWNANGAMWRMCNDARVADEPENYDRRTGWGAASYTSFMLPEQNVRLTATSLRLPLQHHIASS